jgi:uncharacterized repeat protein (TIGR03803 family)
MNMGILTPSERNGWRHFCAAFLFCAAAATGSSGQTFTTLVSFDGTNGSSPVASVTQGTDGDLYGTTAMGGTNCGTAADCGTAFKVTPDGSLTTLYNFCSQTGCSDGRQPGAPMVLAKDGNFYGTTTFGGVDGNDGTIFKLTSTGRLRTIYKFCLQTNCPDGLFPYSGLLQAADGNFYGTTTGGGDLNCSCGTVFKITSTGKLITLHTFHSPDGAMPFAGLIQGTGGNLYGTTRYGGANGEGTVFRITPRGVLTILYSFCAQTNCVDGSTPSDTMVQTADGTLYGVTSGGGTIGFGTVFAMTSGGHLMTLHSFDSNDGAFPDGLMQATDGKLYGTTVMGGDYNDGTIFQITARGNLTVLHRFNGNDGRYPSGLFQATNGSFYGTTNEGGASNGTVYSLSVGLGPFVKAVATAANVGAQVEILGTNLTGATRVTFNSTPATFTVISSTLIKAAVPTGATTGTIEVTTPSGTLSSNVAFQVK